MHFTFFETPFDKATARHRDLTPQEVVSLLTTHVERPNKQGLGFSPCKYIDAVCLCGAENCPGPAGHAINENVEEVYLMPIDLDKGVDGYDLTSPEDLSHLNTIARTGVSFVAHTSHSYAPPLSAKWHVFIPFSRPVKPDEYRRVWKAAIKWLNVPSGIKTDFPARFWNLPSCPPGGQRDTRVQSGQPLDVDWLLAMEPPEVAPADIVHVLGDATDEIRAEAAKDIEARGYADSGQNGHNHTYQIARCLVNDWGLDDDDARSLLADWNHGCTPPWTDAELEHKLQDAIRQGPTEDYGFRRNAMSFLAEYERLSRPDADSPAGRQLWAKQVWSVQDDKTVVEAKDEMFTDAVDFLSLKFPPTPWLISGLLTQGGVATISAEPKATKTWAAMEWCLAVACGDKVFGEFQAYKGKAAYFFAEDQGTSIQSRLKALCVGTGRTLEKGSFFCEPCGQSINVMDDDSVIALIAAASKIGNLSLLVLDPLRDVHTAKEDSSDEMSKLMGRLRRISTILDCTVLFVHHNAKSSADSTGRRHGQKMRGSSAVHGAITSGFYMVDTATDPDTGAIVNTCHTETKSGKSAGSFHVSLDIVDSEHGIAEKATWTILDKDARTRGDNDIADVVIALGDWIFGGKGSHNRPPSAQELTKSTILKLGGRVDDRKAQLHRAKDQGFVMEAGNGKLANGWKLTAMGEKAYREQVYGTSGVALPE